MTGLSRLELAVLTGLAASVAAMMLAASGALYAPPYGEDATFWGARAIRLAAGEIAGEHPPAWPAVVALVAGLTGLDVGRAGQMLAITAFSLFPPTLAIAAAAWSDGPDAKSVARWAGWTSLALPNLAAWAGRVEPTTALVWLAVAAAAVGHPRAGTFAAAFAAFACGAMPLVKENGLLLGAAVAAAIAYARRADRGVMAAAWSVGLVAALAVLALGGAPAGERTALPFADATAAVWSGRLPAAMASPEVPSVWIPRALVHAIRPESHPLTRALALSGIHALRLLAIGGPWFGLGFAAIWALWREGRLGQPLPVLGVALLATTLPGFAIVVQGRHVQPGLLGAVLLLACAARALPAGVRVAALACASVWGAARLLRQEVPHASFVARCASAEVDALAAARAHAGDAVCGRDAWVTFRTGRPAHCTDERWEIRASHRAARPRGTDAPRPHADARRLGTFACRGELWLVPPP